MSRKIKRKGTKVMNDQRLVRLEFESDVLRALVTGEIDHHSARKVREEIDREICTKRPSLLYLELSHVGFMDSSGLGLIMGRYTLMKKLGGGTVLLDPSDAIMRIVKLAGLERIVKIEYTRKSKEESKK